MIPRVAGGYRDYEPFPALVVSNDCEWTKVQQIGDAYPLSIAPLRQLSSFHDDMKPGLEGTIQKNGVRYLFPLPHEEPLDDVYVADFRLIQPITVGELVSLEFWTSVGDAIKPALQGKLVRFYTNAELVRADVQ